jgi:hypothetical protein
MVRNYFLKRYPTRQPARKRVSYQVEVENSPNAHTFLDSDDYQDFEHFVRLESCQSEVFRKL